MVAVKLCCAMVLVGAALALGAPAAEAGVPARSCPAVEDIGLTGSNPADGVAVRARRVSCLRARRVVRAYFPRLVRAGFPDRFRWRRWTCYDPGYVCKARGGKRVRFRLGQS